MTDHTSDDLLKQPEPAVPEGAVGEEAISILDDPIVDENASRSLSEHFIAQEELGGTASGPAAARPRANPPSIEEFVGDQVVSPNPLEEELKTVKRELALLKLTPQERYPEVLSDAEITMEEAHRILNCVVIKLEPWVEKVKMTSELTLTLQTRGMADQRRLEAWAEETRPQLDTTVRAEAYINNIAASLLAYGDKTFADGDATEEERHKATYDALAVMPYPAYRLVQLAVAKFDAKINAVFSEGYLENF